METKSLSFICLALQNMLSSAIAEGNRTLRDELSKTIEQTIQTKLVGIQNVVGELVQTVKDLKVTANDAYEVGFKNEERLDKLEAEIVNLSKLMTRRSGKYKIYGSNKLGRGKTSRI